ncbi:Gluconate 5-dehydrogenase [Arthrobacter saudimassiliensis]|uniref:Gluconate 5-dehydrogenase n=1 Tax=Arthrobacter saudimassiliensis TaxID=1461584 RepID=A0A078MQW4_9MICC|nr:Gluconate 5-dehydrogenase [Arthrobacter saudimassiliensis]
MDLVSSSVAGRSFPAPANGPAADWLGLSGRKVLVAGAGGIGSAVALAFAEAGAAVVTADRDPARLARLGAELKTLEADLATAEGCEDLVAAAAGTLGGLDILIHAVGINHRVPLLDTADEDWDAILAVNLTSAFRLGRAAGRLMVAAGYGRQVYFSSVSGLLAHPDHGPYAASKGGLNQLLRVMAREWAASGVTANAVAPGYTDTDLTSAHLNRPGVRDHYTAQVPAGRLGSVADLTGPALFLASDRAAFITGQVLYTDGGRTLV